MDIPKLRREGKDVELKRELPANRKKFLKDIVAFANTVGGTVYLGADDDGTVYGIGDQDYYTLSDAISNSISDGCTPQIDFDISRGTENNRTYIIIDVYPGKHRPYSLVGQNKETGTYIRVNGTSRPADATKRKELELEGANISFDTQRVIGAAFQAAEAEELCRAMHKEALEQCRTEEERSATRPLTVEKLEDFGILSRVGDSLFPTNAYNLLLGKGFPYAIIQCARFKGTTRSIFIDKKEFSGPVYEQITKAIQFAQNHLNLSLDIRGSRGIETYELPISALREMLCNAVAHRSYIDDSCIQLSIYDDRVEVLSPGSLYGGLTLETMRTGKSKCRNKALAEALHYMHFIEHWGTGIPRILSSCSEYNLQEPTFEDTGMDFRATLYRAGQNETENETERQNETENETENETDSTGVLRHLYSGKSLKTAKRILIEIQNNEAVTIEQLQKNTSFSRATITRYMKQFKEEGILERQGSDIQGAWVLHLDKLK